MELVAITAHWRGQSHFLTYSATPLPACLPFSLLEHMRIPRYFAHDFLMQTMKKHVWSSAWPSLFIGAAGTTTLP